MRCLETIPNGTQSLLFNTVAEVSAKRAAEESRNAERCALRTDRHHARSIARRGGLLHSMQSFSRGGKRPGGLWHREVEVLQRRASRLLRNDGQDGCARPTQPPNRSLALSHHLLPRVKLMRGRRLHFVESDRAAGQDALVPTRPDDLGHRAASHRKRGAAKILRYHQSC